LCRTAILPRTLARPFRGHRYSSTRVVSCLSRFG